MKGMTTFLQKEDGIILITSLVLLVILTLVGITAMQSTTLQERMAGNMEQRDMTFQAAESGLRTGEGRFAQWRANPATMPVFNGPGGFFSRDPADNVTFPAAAAWWNGAVIVDANMPAGALPASYIIERMATQVSGASDSVAFAQLDTVGIYMIRSRAVDAALPADVRVQVLLESSFADPDN